MNRILVADDDPLTCDFFREILSDLEAEVVTCLTPEEAVERATVEGFEVVVSDIHFEESMTGIEVLRAIRKARPGTQVILISGFGTLDTAIAAVREGAYDYVSKPFNVAEVKATVRRALQKLEKLDKKEARRATIPPPHKEDKEDKQDEGEPLLVGSSAKMLAVYKNIAYVADSKNSVLIQGESGTGKELVARAIHAKGSRAPKPFIGVNCGALTETLLESELFGHVKGSFTGAVADKQGLFQAAEGGTLFLDEISETSPALQVKLLRVLQQEECTPVGGTRPYKTNVRVVAATNRDPESLVRQGKLREDLFYRLNVVTINVPPLRERPDDIPRLVAHFVARLAAAGHPAPQVSAKALDALVRYSWPGNVRELENTIERLALFSRGRLIDVEDLPENFHQKQQALHGVLFEGLPTLEEIERRYLLHVLEAVGGNRKRAAEVLGIDRRTLYRMLERFGVGSKAQVS